MSHLNPEVDTLNKDYFDCKTGAEGGEKAGSAKDNFQTVTCGA